MQRLPRRTCSTGPRSSPGRTGSISAGVERNQVTTRSPYDAALVTIDAIQRVAASGKPIDRHTVRDAIETTHLKTMQDEISFDQNGDLVTKVISVFQVVRNPEYPDDDVVHQ
jgi:ABC-type branched-subunit amino acid transport system substrate-binding protein